MNNKLFIDSWGFINLANSDEKYHSETASYFRMCTENKYFFLTSNFVISEVITLLYNKAGHQRSKIFADYIFESINTGFLSLIEINYELMKKALELRYKYQDKPKISFCDLTSMIVMKELNIQEILTMDKHFKQVNMSFELKPILQESLRSH